jgi:hypothetical protein
MVEFVLSGLLGVDYDGSTFVRQDGTLHHSDEAWDGCERCKLLPFLPMLGCDLTLNLDTDYTTTQ